MAISGSLIYLSPADLADLKTQYVACLRAIAVAGASYSIGSRSFTRANIREVSDMLGEITYAQQVQSGGSGSHTQITYSKMDE